jgi:hypothetical protein
MGFLKKIVRKVTKPISKVLDKVVPNELKPFLPYAAAALPFMLGPAAGMGGGSGLGALFRRGLLTGALPNIGAQLAQEGNEGELNPLSVLMATGSGIFSGQGAGDMFRGGMDKGKITGYDKIAGGNMPGQGGVNGVGGFTTNYDTKGISGLGKAKNFLLKGGAKLADTAAGAGEILRDPFAEGTSLLDVAKAGAFPVSQATGDVAYAQANKAMKDFNAQEAAQIVIDAATKAGMDQEYIDAITSSMGDYGYDQTDIDEILRVRGLFASGGRVGFRMGGGDFSAPDFISMDEVTENVDGDVIEDSFEGATAEGYKLNDFEINDMVMQMTGKKIYNLIDDPEAGNFDEFEQLFNMSGKKMYYLKDGSDDGQTYDEFEVREMLYGDQYASGGIINAYNMGGSVLPQGMEMDYRQGGFIPMGSKERADDVPARVSKNEFVMTADAVRAAGGGSVNEGAKRMYGLMNNLEAKA